MCVGWGLGGSELIGVASVGFAGSDVSGAVQSALVLERNSASSSAVASRAERRTTAREIRYMETGTEIAQKETLTC